MSAADNIRRQQENQLYKKVGRKYVPVPDWDHFNGLREGWHLVCISEGCTSHRTTLHPDRAEFDAAMKSNVEKIVPIIRKALESRPSKEEMNPEALAAWKKFIKKWGDHFRVLESPSIKDISEEIIEELSKKP